MGGAGMRNLHAAENGFLLLCLERFCVVFRGNLLFEQLLPAYIPPAPALMIFSLAGIFDVIGIYCCFASKSPSSTFSYPRRTSVHVLGQINQQKTENIMKNTLKLLYEQKIHISKVGGAGKSPVRFFCTQSKNSTSCKAGWQTNYP